jgi:gamma-glutamyltranspeptidase
MPPAEAVTAPRFSTGHHQDSFDPNPDREQAIVGKSTLDVDPGIDTTVRDDLAARGHRVREVEKPIAHPVMIAVDPSGVMYAAGDPAADRHAAALR